MSRRTNPFREADRQRRMADRAHKIMDQTLAKSLKLAMATAMSEFKPPTVHEMVTWKKPWHGVSKPRVKACMFIATLIGARITLRVASPHPQLYSPTGRLPRFTNEYEPAERVITVAFKATGVEMKFTTMQSAAAWLLAEYNKQKEATGGPGTECV